MPELSLRPTTTGKVLLGSRPSIAGVLRLPLEDAPEHKRPVLLREFFERLGIRYDAEPLHEDRIEINLTLQGLPGMQLLSGRLQGARYRRTRLGSDPTDDVGLLVNPKGQHHLSQLGREIVLNDGEATLVSLTDPLDSTNRPPGDLIVLRFPRPQLAPRLAGPQDCFLRRISRCTLALALLTDYLKLIWQEQTLAERDLQPVLVSHLYDLIAVTIGATRDATEMARAGGLRAARFQAFKRDIAENLDRPDLSVMMLADRHCCTPRSVQRLFAMEGTTFTQYVLAQRLARAHRMLTDMRHHGAKISAVAYDSGFGDISHFNRAFRQRYGEAPSQIRAQSRQAG
jgi:AraC-like DNA-binding protein